MKWLVRQSDTDGETIGEVEADTHDEASEKAFDKYKPGWRDDPTFNDDPWDYIYVREKKEPRVKECKIDEKPFDIKSSINFFEDHCVKESVDGGYSAELIRLNEKEMLFLLANGGFVRMKSETPIVTSIVPE